MPTSLTTLRSQPFCVMKAKPPGGPRHCAMHCHRPLKFSTCAEAVLDASMATDNVIAAKKAFMFVLNGKPIYICPGKAKSPWN